MPTKADCRNKHYTIHTHICNKQNITKCACIYEGWSPNLQNRGNSTSPRVQDITSVTPEVTVTVHYRKTGSYSTAIDTNGRHSMSWLTRIRIGHWYVDVTLAYWQTYIL